MKKILVVMFGMLITVTLAACGGETDEPIAIINEEEIMESEWQEQVDFMVSMYEQQGIDFDGEQGEMFLEQIEEQALESLIQERILIQAAEDEGLAVTDEEVDEAFEEQRDFFESDEAFFDALEAAGYTEDSFREVIRTELTVENYFDEHLEEVDVDEEDLEEMYETRKEYYEEQGEEIPDFDEMKEDLEEEYIMGKEQEQMQEIYDELYEESDVERLLGE